MDKDYRAVALAQADEMERQARRIRELIRERNDATSNAEAAYDLAERYARKVGVDIARDDVLRYVEHYWQQRGGLERRLHQHDTFHWDVLRIRHELSRATAAQVAATPTADLVAALIRRIDAVNPLGPARKSSAELFRRPEAPGLVV
ncbi:hypothetical protein [Prauserella muralis]|uniref:Uncharacterized protein n=1 Tax=Prauserella muralis TaxID=588067 RepID=A0A2V4AKP5_9PSEU|nr:hypothetical protein [Prauserella muralis]PXY20845.1 hypothetical protein BAY60_25410 [Prauserella muralis]TWE29882.1 hypothetical protein FHX69_2574 [Prauserella muralis]